MIVAPLKRMFLIAFWRTGNRETRKGLWTGDMGGTWKEVFASSVSITNVVFHDPTHSRCERRGQAWAWLKIQHTRLVCNAMEGIFSVKARSRCLASSSTRGRSFNISLPFALIFLSHAYLLLLFVITKS